MCHPNRKLHGNKTSIETKVMQDSIKLKHMRKRFEALEAKIEKLKQKPSKNKQVCSYSGKDEYDYTREAEYFFLQNEDVLY